MDEESFYTLKLTTETLGHEISHFVGEDNRNREKRKEYILQWAFQELVGAWYFEMNDRIPKLFCIPGQQIKKTTEYPSWDALSSAAQALYTLAQDENEKYRSTERNHRDYVKDLILQIAEDVYQHVPELREKAFEQIWKLVNEEGQVLKEQMRSYVLWEIGLCSILEEKCSAQAQEWTVNELVKDKLKNLFYTVLEDIAKLFRDGQHQNSAQRDMLERFQDQVCYLFGETFADLQAILLLDMKWNDYCMLLQRDEDRTLIQDCLPRMLAVTRALIDCKVWDPQKEPDSFNFGGGDFDAVKELSFVPSEKLITYLYGSNFDPVLTNYLTGYLRTCVNSIQDYFKNMSRNADRDEIRKMYKTLSKPSSMLALQKDMLAFIRLYQIQCLNVT